VVAGEPWLKELSLLLYFVLMLLNMINSEMHRMKSIMLGQEAFSSYAVSWIYVPRREERGRR
jgi:hypothetical protein